MESAFERRSGGMLSCVRILRDELNAASRRTEGRRMEARRAAQRKRDAVTDESNVANRKKARSRSRSRRRADSGGQDNDAMRIPKRKVHIGTRGGGKRSAKKGDGAWEKQTKVKSSVAATAATEHDKVCQVPFLHPCLVCLAKNAKLHE